MLLRAQFVVVYFEKFFKLGIRANSNEKEPQKVFRFVQRLNSLIRYTLKLEKTYWIVHESNNRAFKAEAHVSRGKYNIFLKKPTFKPYPNKKLNFTKTNPLINTHYLQNPSINHNLTSSYLENPTIDPKTQSRNQILMPNHFLQSVLGVNIMDTGQMNVYKGLQPI